MKKFFSRTLFALALMAAGTTAFAQEPVVEKKKQPSVTKPEQAPVQQRSPVRILIDALMGVTDGRDNHLGNTLVVDGRKD